LESRGDKTSTLNIADKKKVIMEYEERFADILALNVLDKPKLSIWMILIPIIFVYYFYEYQKFTNGRKAFAEHYLLSKRRALGEAADSIETGQKPDIEKLAKLSDVPDNARELQSSVLSLFVEHYLNLLRAEGKTYDELIRSAYNNRTNYLLFLNLLNNAEKDVNKSLIPHLADKHQGIESVIGTIEMHSERLRRESAEKIFFA
jgi:hypothetical protein